MKDIEVDHAPHSSSDRVKVLAYYALKGYDEVLYDRDYGFFGDVIDTIDRWDDGCALLLDALEKGKCCGTMRNIILDYRDRFKFLCGVVDDNFGFDKFIERDRKDD